MQLCGNFSFFFKIYLRRAVILDKNIQNIYSTYCRYGFKCSRCVWQHSSLLDELFVISVFQMFLCTGHQSVQSQVQPKYQHDQKVHRGAHRQAVHRAKPDLGRRVQLRRVGRRAEPWSAYTQTLACVTDRQMQV